MMSEKEARRIAGDVGVDPDCLEKESRYFYSQGFLAGLAARDAEIDALRRENEEQAKLIKTWRNHALEVEKMFEGERALCERERALADRLAEALRKAHYELNGIRARSGVPCDYDGVKYGVDEAYFSSVVDESKDAIAAYQAMRKDGGR